MGKPSAPPPPDYRGAAQEQGAANLEAARAQAKLSNPNVISPTGTQTVQYGGGPPTFDQGAYDKAMGVYNSAYEDYLKQRTAQPSLGLRGLTRGNWRPLAGDYNAQSAQAPIAPNMNEFYRQSGDPDVPTVTQTLSPEQQAIFDKTTQTKDILGDIGIQGAEGLRGIVGAPLDYSGAPEIGDSQATRDKVFQAMMSRVNEDYGNAESQRHSQLIASGIRPGTDAYDDAMNLLSRGRNDARQRAIIAEGQEAQRDFGMDSENRRRFIGELLSRRQTPLNEVSALLSGSQVNNPFAIPGFAGSQQVMPAPLYGATNAAGNYAGDLYNADVGNYNATMQGLMGLGTAGVTAYGLMNAAPLLALSDIRLKSNIERIGTHPLGVGIYEYDIFDRREVGVMAQELLEVKPEAVFRHPSGYLMVDYGSL